MTCTSDIRLMKQVTLSMHYQSPSDFTIGQRFDQLGEPGIRNARAAHIQVTEMPHHSQPANSRVGDRSAIRQVEFPQTRQLQQLFEARV